MSQSQPMQVNMTGEHAEYHVLCSISYYHFFLPGWTSLLIFHYLPRNHDGGYYHGPTVAFGATACDNVCFAAQPRIRSQ
jgi:hypothetical protein